MMIKFSFENMLFIDEDENILHVLNGSYLGILFGTKFSSLLHLKYVYC